MAKLVGPVAPNSKLVLGKGIELDVDKDGAVEVKDDAVIKQLLAAGFKELKKRSSRSSETTAAKKTEAPKVEKPKADEPKEEKVEQTEEKADKVEKSEAKTKSKRR